MLKDWTLVDRLARELDAVLRGVRLTDAGLLDDGRPALAFAGRAELLVLDPFAGTPLVFFAAAELSVAGDPGYMRAIATALRGMRVGGVRAWPGERILAFSFAARSRFGVVDEYRLLVELIPRFGNVLLLKDATIVAAAKQFGPAENAHRIILVGGRYAPPPARPSALCAPVVAPGESEGPALLPALADLAARRSSRALEGALERTRAALQKRIARRLAALRAERERLAARRADEAGRDRLRRSGEALYAYAYLVEPRATRFTSPADPDLEIELDPQLDAKGNAAAIFARYRKLVDGLPHVERRLAHVDASIAALDELAWQVEGADSTALAEIAPTLGESKAQPKRPGKGRRRRSPQHRDLPSGARIYVGRTPEENAEVTFRIGRPSDLWFHVREQPGAHVVLHLPPGTAASPADLETAAATAAFFSRARSSERVAVDYAERKYVRKQRDAPPGRVWYTNAQTLFVAPRDPAS